jgi:hypothetical protein
MVLTTSTFLASSNKIESIRFHLERTLRIPRCGLSSLKLVFRVLLNTEFKTKGLPSSRVILKLHSFLVFTLIRLLSSDKRIRVSTWLCVKIKMLSMLYLIRETLLFCILGTS